MLLAQKFKCDSFALRMDRLPLNDILNAISSLSQVAHNLNDFEVLFLNFSCDKLCGFLHNLYCTVHGLFMVTL
jgi:hypothetical protein